MNTTNYRSLLINFKQAKYPRETIFEDNANLGLLMTLNRSF
jgi:hypothetical protein